MLRKTRNRLRNLSVEFINRLRAGTLSEVRVRSLSIAESLEKRTLFTTQTATLIAGGDPGQLNDGAITVTVDPYGGFGHRMAASGAIFNPPGSRRPQETINSSAVYFSPLGNFLTTDSIITNNHGLSGATFISQTHNTKTDVSTAVSQFIINGSDGITYQVTLTQTLTPYDPTVGRGTLTQTYQIKNLSSVAATNVKLDHYLSSELDWDAVDGVIPVDADLGARSGDGRILFAFDSGDADSTYVSIRNDDPNGAGMNDGTYNGEAEFNPNLTVASHIEENAKNTQNIQAGASGAAGSFTFPGGQTGGGMERPFDKTFFGQFYYPSADPLDNPIDNPTFPNFQLATGSNFNQQTNAETYWPTILAAKGIPSNTNVTYHGLVFDSSGNPVMDPTTGFQSIAPMTIAMNDIDTFPADRGAAGNVVDGPFATEGSEGDNHFDDNSLKDAGPVSLTSEDEFHTIPAGGTITYTTRTDWGQRNANLSFSPGVFSVTAGNVDEPPGDPAKGATGVARNINVHRAGGTLGVADIGIVSADAGATSYLPDGSAGDYLPVGFVDPSTETVPGDPTTGKRSGFTSVHFADGQTDATVPIIVLPDLKIEGDEQIQISMYANFPIKDGASGSPHFDLSAFTNPVTNQVISAGTVSVHTAANDQQAFPTFWNVGQKQEGEPDKFEFTNIHIPANDAPGSVSFESATQSVDPRSGSINVPVDRTGNFDPSAEVSFTYTLSGTAVENADYGVPFTIDPDTNLDVPATFDPTTGLWTGTGRYPIGGTATNITIPLINNPSIGPNKTIVVNVTATAPATNGSITTDTITLLNKNNFGSFAFSAANYSITEGKPSVGITIVRSGGSDNAVTIPFSITGVTATAGSDYSDVSGNVIFGDGQTAATVTIPIINDSIPELTETANLALGLPSNGTLGSPSTAVLTIVDDDVTGRVQFSSSTYSVREGQPTVTLTLNRTGDSTTAISVPYSTTDGGAVAGADYSATSGTINFAANQLTATINVPIINNSVVDGTRNFTVSLGTPVGLAFTGSPATATVSIADNDSRFQFSAPSYSFNENAGTATITVTRIGNSSSAVTLNYSTAPGSALNNVDFQPVAGVLTFAANQSTGTITIPLIDRPLVQTPVRSFSISISTPIGTFGDQPDNGAALGNPPSASVNINHVERAHPSVSGMNIVTPPNGLERLVVSFNKAMDASTVNIPQNYTVDALDAKGNIKKHIRVSAATYNPATNSVTLLPLPTLSANTVYQVTVKANVVDTGGRNLAATPLGAPADFVGRTAFGSKISYVDKKGNLVTLQTKKGGTIFYNRFNGLDTINIGGVNPGVTSLTGSVKAQRGTDGVTIIDSLTGTSGLRILLPDNKFLITSVS